MPIKRQEEGGISNRRSQQALVDQRFSNIRNKCIHCGGNHAPGTCPTRMQPQVAPSTVSYMAYKGNTSAGKTNDNVSAPYSTKNGQSIAGSTTLTSLVNNVTGTQGRTSGNHAPQVTRQVSPNVPQQKNSYIHNNIPPMQIPNQFPPPPYFLILFPPPPIAPSNVSNAPSAPASDISAAITLMTNAVTQGNSNTMAIMDALERTTTQFADALQQTIQMGVDAQAQETKMQSWTNNLIKLRYLMVPNHLNATHGWKRYMPCVSKQEGPSAKCYYYVQVRLFMTSSQTCLLMQLMIRPRMTSSPGTRIYKG